MNLRRINASKRTGIYGKLLIWCFITGLILWMSISTMMSWQGKEYKVPLENRTCDEIYNLSIHNKLFSNDKALLYTPDSVMIYYIENCQEDDSPDTFSLYWACMDGCFNMEEILLGDLSYENKTQEAYHSNCTSMCSVQYVE